MKSKFKITILILYIRIILNKKLYSELDNLEKVVDTKNEQNSHLTRQLEQSNDNNSRLYNEKIVLEKNVYKQ